MNYGCEGKVAFISGGTSGIGKAVAELLLKDGAEVWLLGRDAEKGTEAAVTLSAYGKVHYVQGDVKDLEACRSAAQNVREQRENIDLIVNAAGIYQERRLEKVTEYDFFSIMDTNVKGTIFLTQTLLPLLAAEGASIVNIASDAGINGNYGCPLYCASKGAVVAFTKALALDLAPRVRVNCICPGDVATPMLGKQLQQADGSYTLEDVELQTIPCSYEEIEKYATLIYQGMKSSYLTLSGPNNHGVRISISGYPYLAIWTAKKNAPFICLEPWYGHADFSRVEEDFSHREGMMTLSAS